MSLLTNVRWVLRHPAAATSPAAVLTRLALWRARTALHMGATVPIAGARLRFWCPPEWRGNAKMTYVWRDDYEAELAQLHRWVRPGDAVMDVGAHYGSYTLPLAGLVGAQGRVFAVEPAAHARSVLSRNVRLNHLRNVQVLPVAAGAEPSRATLHLHADRSRASLHEHETPEKRSVAEPVEVVRLDDVVWPEGPFSLIKMDVEGHEPQALRGAAGILARDRPVVIFELLSRNLGAAGSARAAWDLLIAHGYRMHRVTDEGEVRQVESPEHRCGTSHNVIAVHPDGREGIGMSAVRTGAAR